MARSLTRERSSSETSCDIRQILLEFLILLILVSNVHSDHIGHPLHCSMLYACVGENVCLSPLFSTALALIELG